MMSIAQEDLTFRHGRSNPTRSSSKLLGTVHSRSQHGGPKRDGHRITATFGAVALAKTSEPNNLS
eukprot:1553-Heterocapsa_arctica.AAC.1